MLEIKSLSPPSFLEDISVAQAAGSIISTASDLLTWNTTLHQKSFLPKPLYELFITENLGHYAYGIYRFKFCGETVLTHQGGIGAFTTDLCYIPDHELTIIRLSNIRSDSSKIDEEFKEMMEKLKDQIPDESKRFNAVRKIMSEKYPDKRGVSRLENIIEAFFEE